MKSPFPEMRRLWEQPGGKSGVMGNRPALRLQVEIQMEVLSRLWGDRSGVQSDIHLRVISV